MADSGVTAQPGRRRALAMQAVTTLALSMGHFLSGSSQALAGVLAEQLTSEGADITLTESQLSWVVSIQSIGQVAGFLVSSYVHPRLGAVRVIQLCAPLMLASWLFVAFGGGLWVLLAGRALTGLACGITVVSANTHIGEVSSVNVRGYCVAFMFTMTSVGMTSGYLFGWLLGWRHGCLVFGIPPIVIQFIITLMLPRSAKWVVTKGHSVEEAERSLRFYNGPSCDVSRQIREIHESLGRNCGNSVSLIEAFRLLKHRQYRVPFGLIFGLGVFYVFSGGFATMTLAPVILKDIGGFSNPYMGSILMGVVRSVATLVCSIFIERCERKTILIINGAIGALACLVTAFFFFFNEALAAYTWVSMSTTLVIVCSMSAGIAPISGLLFSELLPNAVRSELGGICMCVVAMLSFVMLYSFSFVVSEIGMSGLYWCFTAMQLMMLAYAQLCLPKTRGRSIEEIQKMFMKSATPGVADSATTICESPKPTADVSLDGLPMKSDG